MTTHTEQQLGLSRIRLGDARKALESIEWTRAQIDDRQTSRDLDALRNHIDNAVGRLSTLVHTLARLEARRG